MYNGGALGPSFLRSGRSSLEETPEEEKKNLKGRVILKGLLTFTMRF